MFMRRPYAKLAVLLSLLLIAGLVIPATVAYIAIGTDPLVNIFEPDYTQTADAVVDVYVRKEVTNLIDPPITAEGFQFLLTRTDTENAIQLITNADGYAHAMLHFTKDEAGKSYTYRICEVNDARENVLYDETVYTMNVALKLNDNAVLVPTVTFNGLKVDKVEASFTNYYTTEIVPPDTGDHAHPLLYVLMMLLGVSGIGGVLLFYKRRTV